MASILIRIQMPTCVRYTTRESMNHPYEFYIVSNGDKQEDCGSNIVPYRSLGRVLAWHNLRAASTYCPQKNFNMAWANFWPTVITDLWWVFLIPDCITPKYLKFSTFSNICPLILQTLIWSPFPKAKVVVDIEFPALRPWWATASQRSLSWFWWTNSLIQLKVAPCVHTCDYTELCAEEWQWNLIK